MSLYTSGNSIYDTVNWISNVLPGRHEETGRDKDEHRGLIVKPEHVVVDPDFVELGKALNLTEEPQHGETSSGLEGDVPK